MSEILKRLLAEGKLRKHTTSAREIAALFDVVDRDMADALVDDLSLDRRFAIAYEAALTLGTVTLYCEGYETHGYGHHHNTFQALRGTMGSDVTPFADYFDMCRTKRSAVVYDRTETISEGEVWELLQTVQTFRGLVERWLEKSHPALWRRS